MGFDRGSASFRMFYLPGGLPVDYLERFKKHAAPPMSALGREPLQGWVTHRHLLDNNITEDSAHLAGYLFLTLMKAERRIPPALLNVELKMEELARLQADGRAFLKRSERSEMRKEITERLLPQMPPQLTGIPMVYDPDGQLMLAQAMSDKQADAFMLGVKETLGTMPFAVTPEAAALRRLQVNVRDLAPTSFSPECSDSDGGDKLGHDFLTWLWFFSEMQGGTLQSKDFGKFSVMLEGPLTFIREGAGAYEAVLRKGSPLIAAEARAALLAGKKLAGATVNLVRGEDVWRGNVDAGNFRFRAWRLPKGDAVDPVGRFQERMLSLQVMTGMWMECFDRFLQVRGKASKWKDERSEIHKWVSERQAKA